MDQHLVILALRLDDLAEHLGPLLHLLPVFLRQVLLVPLFNLEHEDHKLLVQLFLKRYGILDLLLLIFSSLLQETRRLLVARDVDHRSLRDFVRVVQLNRRPARLHGVIGLRDVAGECIVFDWALVRVADVDRIVSALLTLPFLRLPILLMLFDIPLRFKVLRDLVHVFLPAVSLPMQRVLEYRLAHVEVRLFFRAFVASVLLLLLAAVRF